MREASSDWKAAVFVFIALVLVAGIACSPENESETFAPSGPDYAHYQNLADQASSMLESGQNQEALNLFQAALQTIAQTPDPDPLKVATAHDDVAKTQMLIAPTRDDPSPVYADALDHYQQALNLRIGVWGEDAPKIATSLDRLGRVHLEMTEYDQAESYFQRALDIRMRETLPASRPAIVTSFDNLAVVHLRQGDRHMGEEDYQAAVSEYDLALGYRKKASSPIEVAPILDRLAEAYSQMKEYERALSFSQRALNIREDTLPAESDDLVTSRHNVALLHGKIADIHFGNGQYGTAQDHFDQAIETLRATSRPDPKLLASALINLSVLYGHLGDYGQSLLLLRDALDILTESLGENHLETVAARRNLAYVYMNLGDNKQAQILFEKILDISGNSDSPDSIAKAIILSDLASAHFRNGEHERALPLFQNALAVARETKGANSPEVVPFMNNLGVMYRKIGETEEALTLYEDALRIRREQLSSDDPALATSLNNLGTLYFSLGSYDQALPRFQEALQIRQKVLGPTHPESALSLNNLGVLYASQGDYLLALEQFTDALPSQDRTFNSLFAVASEEQKLLFVNASQSTYQLTLSLIFQHFNSDPEIVRQGMELVLARKGAVLDAQSKTQEAILANLSDPEHLAAWHRLRRLRSDLAHLLLNVPDSGEFSDYRGKIDNLEKQLREEEIFLSKTLIEAAPVFSQDPVEPGMIADNLPANSAYVEYVRVQEWVEQDRNWADAGRYLAFVLTADDQVTLADIGDAREIDAQVAVTRGLIENLASFEDLKAHTNNSDAALSDLYRRLIQPLSLPLDSLKRLIVSPDGELNKVPFAALRSPDGRYLVESLTLSYVTSGRDLLPKDAGLEPEVDLLLVADLDYDASDQRNTPDGPYRGAIDDGESPRWSFAELPGTAEEAELILPLVPGAEKTVLRRAEGTESALFSVRRPRIVHFATHGFFLPDMALPLTDPTSIGSFIKSNLSRGAAGVKEIALDPVSTDLSEGALSSMVRSGLALSGANQSRQGSTGNDGILTALEVTGMDLRGTELVVLSACQTAEGDVRNGEGSFGLRRAFALAGADNVLMSQWPVNDKLTVNQMVWFYEGAFIQSELVGGPSASETGKVTGDLAEALRQAQLRTIDLLRETFEKEMGEPLAPVKLWAPFIIQVSGN